MLLIIKAMDIIKADVPLGGKFTLLSCMKVLSMKTVLNLLFCSRNESTNGLKKRMNVFQVAVWSTLKKL